MIGFLGFSWYKGVYFGVLRILVAFVKFVGFLDAFCSLLLVIF